MIERISLNRFQLHDSVEVELDPHVTVLVGQTGAGKTAVIRGLSFVTRNSPSKVSLVKKGCNKMKGVLEFDGHKLERIRTVDGKKNLYVLDGKKLKAFGKEKVPEEVSKLLNLEPVNFQYQHDRPYWFFEKKGEVGRQLNRIVNLELIDHTLSEIATEVRKARSVVTVSESRYDQAKKEKKDLAWVPRFLKDFDRLDALEMKAREAKKSVDLLRLLIVDARTYSRQKEEALAAKDAAGETLRAARQCMQNAHAAGVLSDAIGQVKRLKVRRIDLGPLESVRKKADAVAERRRNVEVMVDDLKRAEKDRCDATKEARRAERELHRKTKGICPICGRTLNTSRNSKPFSKTGRTTTTSSR